MKIPDNMTEAEVVKLITDIVEQFATKFKFGCYDKDDIAQESWLFALDGLERYDGRVPLANFMRVHIRNRLISLRRNKHGRVEPPCKTCPFSDERLKKSQSGCVEYVGKHECEEFYSWSLTHSRRVSLSEGLDILSVPEESNSINYQDNVHEDVSNNEIVRRLIDELPVSYRADLLRILDGAYICTTRREKLGEQIRIILGDNYGEREDV